MPMFASSPAAARLVRAPPTGGRAAGGNRRRGTGSTAAKDEARGGGPAEEVRIDAIEKKLAKKKLSIAEQEALRNKEAIRSGENVVMGGGRRKTKEKSLWDKWAGDGGGLSQMNDITYKLALGLAFIWVVFRFVLPALGVYQLVNDLSAPPPPA